MRASLEVKKKKPNIAIIEQAHAILVRKSFQRELSEEGLESKASNTENNTKLEKRKSKVSDDAYSLKDDESSPQRDTSDTEVNLENNLKYNKSLNYKPQRKSYAKYIAVAILVVGVYFFMNSNKTTLKKDSIESKIQEHGYSKVSFSHKKTVNEILVDADKKIVDTNKVYLAAKQKMKKKRVNFNKISKKNGLSYEKSTQEPFTGVVEYSIGGGDVGMEESFKDGKKHGKSISWYANGKREWEDNYKNGKRYGKSSEWYKSGQKKTEINYKNGKRYGKSIVWYRNGYKKAENYFKNGKLDGLNVQWGKDGKKSCDCFYKNGKQDGVTILWCCGKKVYKLFYENGVQVKKVAF